MSEGTEFAEWLGDVVVGPDGKELALPERAQELLVVAEKMKIISMDDVPE